jgi:hypothetical protein
VEKYSTAGQAVDDNTIRRMRFACWITKATNTHSELVIVIGFQHNSGNTKTTQCFVACLVYFQSVPSLNVSYYTNCDTEKYSKINHIS